MSALALTILNSLMGGLAKGAATTRGPEQDADAAQAFDATLAESLRDTTPAPLEACDEQAATPADASSTPTATTTDDDLLQSLLTLGAASSAAKASGVQAAPVDEADMLRSLLTLSAGQSAGAGVSATATAAAAAGTQAAPVDDDPLSRRLLTLGAAIQRPVAADAPATTQAGAGSAPTLVARNVTHGKSSKSADSFASADHGASSAGFSAARAGMSSPPSRSADTASASKSADRSAPQARVNPRSEDADREDPTSPPISQANVALVSGAPPDPALVAALAQPVATTSMTRVPAPALASAAPSRSGKGTDSGVVAGATRREAPFASAGSTPQASSAQIASDHDPATTRVQVIDLKSWLAPVAPPQRPASPTSSPNPVAPAATSPATPPPPASDSQAVVATAPAASPVDVSAAISAGASAQNVPLSAPSSAPSAPRASDAASAPPAVATSSIGSPPVTQLAPRRDLEVTLTPRELGGLAVRMKSQGDRLEIAFVAEKSDTARLIDDKSAKLEGQLRDAGLGLGGVEISVAAQTGADFSAGAGTGGDTGGTPAGGRQEWGQQSGQGSGSAPSGQEFSRRAREGLKDETSDRTDDAPHSRGDRGLYL